MADVECVWKINAQCGEGPVWLEEDQALYWVDIKNPNVHRFGLGDGSRQSWPMPERVGFVVPRRRGGFVAGFKSGVVTLAPRTMHVAPLLAPEPDMPTNRLNDAKADAKGRLWMGSMDDAEETPTGWLYRVDPDLTCTRSDGPYKVTNGPAINADASMLYHVDTFGGTVYAFDMTGDGRLLNKRVFAQIPAVEGYPDGLTVDADNYVWLAHWGGWRITRFTPQGEVDRVVKLPVAQVTSCAFAGAELDRLFVTSAAIGLDEAALAEQPLAGSLFEVIDVGASGLPPGRFEG